MMRDTATIFLSLMAMGLSTVTTYLTFFDERLTLRASIDRVSYSYPSGGGASDGLTTASFQYYATPGIILSHQGTRPLVLTNLRAFKSLDGEACEPPSESPDDPLGGFEPVILEPGSVRRLTPEFSLGRTEAESRTGRFDLADEETRWCLQATLYDQRSERLSPTFHAFDFGVTYTDPEPGERYPTNAVRVDFPRGASTLVKSGLF